MAVEIDNEVRLRTKLYDRRDDFNFIIDRRDDFNFIIDRRDDFNFTIANLRFI